MCRLLYLTPGHGFNVEEIREFISQLDTSQGGHGIGAWSPTRGLIKGVKYTAKEAASLLDPGIPLLVHCRMTSAGVTCDALCHPFHAGEYGFLAHNGHWGDYKSHSLAIDLRLGELTTVESDTLRMAQLVTLLGPAVLGKLDAGTVLLAAPDGSCRAWKTSFSSLGVLITKRGVLYASEQPKAIDGEWIDLGSLNGETLAPSPKGLPKREFPITPLAAWGMNTDWGEEYGGRWREHERADDAYLPAHYKPEANGKSTVEKRPSRSERRRLRKQQRGAIKDRIQPGNGKGWEWDWKDGLYQLLPKRV